MSHISVLGAGAWGTALAVVASQSGATVTLWSRNPEVRDTIASAHENRRYLPGIRINPSIKVTDNLKDAAQADALVLVVPAQKLREFCQGLTPYITTRTPLILCCKGIEQDSLMLMSEVVASVLPANPVAILSGPNFADEVARGLPTATTLACEDAVVREQLAFLFRSATFRPYTSDDAIGAQIGGAVKNVLAIACGIVQGKGLGENAKAALITRGMAEMQRLAIAKGGKSKTLMGLSGMGDLILTCGSIKSRNMSLGFALGEGVALEAILSERHSVTEGVATAKSVVELARKLQVDMPICEAVNAILHENAAIEETMKSLLNRPLVME